MKEERFASFLGSLESITSKDKAVNSRMSKVRKIERDLKVNLDIVVLDDYQMYQTLLRIQREFGDKNGAIQNVLRKYYIFINGREFPSILECKKRFG
ncbi:hypothetical protein E0485_17395 [Paenibacillus albiflavus]|uniref:Uncharacterized protein n=1 Tax=Paenibacillus albiflavus TaxID=2545760 RepID=A0A4R4EB68_9BACL|nr:hypothetical protein [Paenibacillus albiflavus]TCZ75381.1 hypothetical protein E0485_17395 [Paenibacillus albiflavus]